MTEAILPRRLTRMSITIRLWGRGARSPWPQFFGLIGLVLNLVVAPALAQTPAAFEQARLAAASGRLAYAQAILEKLVSRSPDTPAYRLALAEVLMRLGETDRAVFQYQQLDGADLGPKDRAHVAQRLEAIRRADGWNLRLSFGLVPQTNVGKRTAADSIVVGGIDFALDSASRAKSGVGLAFAAGASRRINLEGGTALRFAMQVQGYAYQDRSFNDVRFRTSLGIERQLGKTVLLEAGVVQNTRFLGDKRFSLGPGLWLGGQVKLSDRSLFTLRAQADWLKHPTSSGLDGPRQAIMFGLRHQVSPSLSLTAQLALDQTNAQLSTQSGKGISLSLGVRKQLKGGLLIGFDLTKRHERREGTEPLFGVRREDRTTTLALRVAHRSFAIAGYAPMVEVTQEKRTSTVAPANFRNISVGFHLTRDF